MMRGEDSKKNLSHTQDNFFAEKIEMMAGFVCLLRSLTVPLLRVDLNSTICGSEIYNYLLIAVSLFNDISFVMMSCYKVATLNDS